MSESTETKVTERNVEKPEETARHEEHHAKKEGFHPHGHHHVAIHPPNTSVTHLEPGTVRF